MSEVRSGNGPGIGLTERHSVPKISLNFLEGVTPKNRPLATTAVLGSSLTRNIALSGRVYIGDRMPVNKDIALPRTAIVGGGSLGCCAKSPTDSAEFTLLWAAPRKR